MTIPNQLRARGLLSIFQGNLPPCLWFYGPRGSGQEEVAYETFQGLYVDRDHKKFIKPKLDEIIAVRQWALTRPEIKYKFVLIDGVDTISKEAANFLLKVVEDSPEYVRWVLISESKDILPPLKSRSLVVPFRSFKESEVASDFGGSLFLKKEMERISFGFVKSQLLEVLESKEYYKAFMFWAMLKRICEEITPELELLRNTYLYCCNVMAEYYKNDVKRLASIQKTRNILRNHVRSEQQFKVLFIKIL